MNYLQRYNKFREYNNIIVKINILNALLINVTHHIMLFPELVRLDRLFGRFNRCVRRKTFVGNLGYRNGCPGR